MMRGWQCTCGDAAVAVMPRGSIAGHGTGYPTASAVHWHCLRRSKRTNATDATTTRCGWVWAGRSPSLLPVAFLLDADSPFVPLEQAASAATAAKQPAALSRALADENPRSRPGLLTTTSTTSQPSSTSAVRG